MIEESQAEAGAAQGNAPTEEESIMMRLEVHLASPSHGMVFREGPRLRREPGHVPPPDDPLLINWIQNFFMTLEGSEGLQTLTDRWFKDSSWLKRLP